MVCHREDESYLKEVGMFVARLKWIDIPAKIYWKYWPGSTEQKFLFVDVRFAVLRRSKKGRDKIRQEQH